MRTRSRLGWAIAGVLPLLACSNNQVVSPAPLSHPAGADLALSWGVTENFKNGSVRFGSELTIENSGSVALGNRGWTLYFNCVNTILSDTVPAGVKITRINGDFQKLEPTDAFKPIGPGQSMVIPFDGEYFAIKQSDAPRGYYVVFTDDRGQALPPEPVGKESVEPFTTDKQTTRVPIDVIPVPTAKTRYDENKALTLLPPGDVAPLVPTPVLLQAQEGEFSLASAVPIHHGPGLEREASFLASSLEKLLGAKPKIKQGAAPEGEVAISLTAGSITVDGRAVEEGGAAYNLTISPAQGVSIVGSDAAGVFYGIQSLRALLPVSAYERPEATLTLGAVTVEDAPRFAYRGMLIDVARHFQTKEEILKVLDIMSFYKLNKFHFHLTDDEGFRLEVKPLPELTEVGGRRGHTLDERDLLQPAFGSGPDPESKTAIGSGHYTREDFIEILKYARDRHIQVIPELDLPGHARAAIASMEARHARLMAANDPAGAKEFLLSEPEDKSTYVTPQFWHHNVVNPCLDSTYKFINTVIDEIVAMYEEAGAPLESIHTGGDEVPGGVWEGSPACKALVDKTSDDGIDSVADLSGHFLREYSKILANHQLITAGWEEIGLKKVKVGDKVEKQPNPTFAGSGFRTFVWNNIWGTGEEGNAYELANAGYTVVLSNATNLYFDFAYDKDPQEPGAYWGGFVDTRKPFELVPLDLYKNAEKDQFGNPVDPALIANAEKLTAEGAGRILGIQGQLWAETVVSQDLLEHYIFPKLLGLAERAWAPDPAWANEPDATTRAAMVDEAWNRFANTLGRRDLPRLDYLSGGVGYRLPPPGARIADGKLEANVAFAGLAIRYTTDGSEPTASSTLYSGPVSVKGVVKLRTFNTRGKGSMTSTLDTTEGG
ncbi:MULTISPECIES: family 20 glycosylhydrolase [Sorangium]|uniref:family 20 glycosylhydrolase n=1 Tax=Sorangium TaxID=39643 RepID=UPI003D9C08A5